MNKREYLLVCLMEECAEVQKAASKALRFGLKDGNPSSNFTNAEDLENEISDFVSVANILAAEGAIILDANNDELIRKKDKVNRYMEYSKEQGTLTE